jgi:hypothetical protein
MTTLELLGRITDEGELLVQLPAGLPAGAVIVRIDILADAAWTDEEVQTRLTPQRKTFKELAAWLDANPPTEPYGDLRDDEDAVVYLHRKRRQAAISLDEPGENE